MADSNIGALPLAPNVADDSLLVMEQQGTAMKVTGYLLKTYAKQGVELEFQDALDEAKDAAASAAGAVSAVTDMTVSAHTSDTASVTKSTKNGVVNLDFGLPRGEQGIPGPEGKTGPRGPQGTPGTGLDILGHYDTEEALRAAVTAPDVGGAYGVGQSAPYDIYVFDGVTLDWKNYGPLGGSGGVVPENVVTAEGGAVLEIPAETFGDAPHTILFTEEEDTPLTADDIEYGSGSVKDALDGLFTSVSDGKALIASAVTDKGVDTAPDAPFAEIAENIGKIQTGGDTSDATATPGDILAPKTAYTAAGKVEGIIPSLPAQTITPGTADKTIANGQYLAGTQTIKGDPNLTSANIKKGVALFGVAGALETSFAATLTVTADIGAVVTATCGDTSIEALSTTGTVVLELPIEGTWKVTAVRGVAQYNTVTLEVSSQYSAALTAEVHIERFVTATPLEIARYGLAAATIGDYAIFAGGAKSISSSDETSNVDVYDNNLTRTTGTPLYYACHFLAAASNQNYALFAGGIGSNISYYVSAFDKELTRTNATSLSAARYSLAAASIGNYILFGGGYTSNNVSSPVVDAYDNNLTRTIVNPGLISGRGDLAASSNENHAIFGGGEYVDAYDKNLTRTTPTFFNTPRISLAAGRAGNYVIFGGGGQKSGLDVYEDVDAYDLFLTRTTPESLKIGRARLSATSLNGYCLFCGGRYFENAPAGSAFVAYARPSAAVDIYDPYLVRSDIDNLDSARYNIAATCLGEYALFGGGGYEGYSGTLVYQMPSKTVDVYRYV